MDMLSQISAWVVFCGAIATILVRYLPGWTREAKRRAARIISVPWGVAGITYTWLQPSLGQGPNVWHIIVYFSLGIGLLSLIDYAVDRRRARMRDRSGAAE